MRSLKVMAAAAILFNVSGAAPGAAAPAGWHDTKCERYKRAWQHVLAYHGTRGLSSAFLDRHAAFLASNCTRRSDVCARSDEEIALANTMVVLSMNFGAASTFAPFYCR